MNRILGLAVLVAGVALLVYGFSAMDSLNSHVSRIFNGAPSNKSLMLLVSGGALTIFGALSFLRDKQS